MLPRLRAKLIAEAANGPRTPDADRVLADKGCLIIPDILCKAGGVSVCYLEHTQESQHEQVEEAYVDDRLSQRMNRRVGSRGSSLRSAAMKLALETVAKAMIGKGALPQVKRARRRNERHHSAGTETCRRYFLSAELAGSSPEGEAPKRRHEP